MKNPSSNGKIKNLNKPNDLIKIVIYMSDLAHAFSYDDNRELNLVLQLSKSLSCTTVACNSSILTTMSEQNITDIIGINVKKWYRYSSHCCVIILTNIKKQQQIYLSKNKMAYKQST